MKIKLSLLALIFFTHTVAQTAIPWKVIELLSHSRIDAMADLGHGVVLVGTRNTTPARIFKSMDYGFTWKQVSTLESAEKRSGITCIQSAGDGYCYALNESSEFFKSDDNGETWQRITKLSSGINTEGHALAYGICITKQGTILVSDANSSGGSIYRSTDRGLTFSKLKSFTSKGLYRFTILKSFIIVNGWEGCVFRSKDDGLTWGRLAEADKSPLYATESLGGNRYLQGTEAGNIYVGNGHSKTIKFLAKPGGAADDFVYVGNGTIIYSTYTDSQHVFSSQNMGKSWIDERIVPTGQSKDWLDHVIRIEKKDSVVILGGTNKGFILRTMYALKDLRHNSLK